MTGRTHDAAAITALGAFAVFSTPQPVTLATVIAAILANQIGGIAPDIDQPTAPFWRNLPIGGLFGRAVDKLLGGHRFLTHSLLGLALFGFLARTFLIFIHPVISTVDIGIVWWAFMIGMVSHLVMDSLTKEGVPWLLPIPIKFGIPPLKHLRVTTGHFMENFVIFPALIALNVWFYGSHYHHMLVLLHRYVI